MTPSLSFNILPFYFLWILTKVSFQFKFSILLSIIRESLERIQLLWLTPEWIFSLLSGKSELLSGGNAIRRPLGVDIRARGPIWVSMDRPIDNAIPGGFGRGRVWCARFSQSAGRWRRRGGGEWEQSAIYRETWVDGVMALRNLFPPALTCHPSLPPSLPLQIVAQCSGECFI